MQQPSSQAWQEYEDICEHLVYVCQILVVQQVLIPNSHMQQYRLIICMQNILMQIQQQQLQVLTAY